MPVFLFLFLSADADSVREAAALGLPAGQVMAHSGPDHDAAEPCIAFDFDGVLASDESEPVYQAGGLDSFNDHEVAKATKPLPPGPLYGFFTGINCIQRLEEERHRSDPTYTPLVRVALVTARGAPAHERALASLKSWGATVNDAFFLGGVDKGRIIEVLRPHIFFDQAGHIESTRHAAPSVHVPYGAMNAASHAAPSVHVPYGAMNAATCPC
ncbi:5'-nucleotidase [Georgenia sp. EYE_87]|uniref:5'-nucleotidase n=1 Tax=Georgenia sp. EYE_87 TaxID=2853448 RepID=UPI0020038341|nr:5'-nucleotidase [Georgenia sp. EYE_87]MCK6210047.1 5'-nucleotidase [Georgenia sp. EYE_87]